MKQNILLLFSLILLGQSSHTHAQQVPVFVAGNEGHKSYRIPAIIKIPKGDILAFAEGRLQGSGDFGDINIVMKRSTDNGKTWSSLSTIVDYDTLQAGNPAPVFDDSDPAFPKGRIFLFYNTGNNHEGEVRKGKGLREVWYKTSTDGGFTWSEGVNITLQVHKPKQPNTNPAYNFNEDWRSYANTPGHATQFSAGKYKGRIYVAANHSQGNPQKQFADYFAHGFYTDNHGQSFQLSKTIEVEGGNEATATAISGDRLMLNARNQKGDIRQRIVAISNDGGQNWDKTFYDANLPDPVCEGSILTIGKKNGKHILAFCNAADTQKRNNLTLKISFDDGLTWTIAKLIDTSDDKDNHDYTAYSDIVQTKPNEVGVLYERNGYTQIVFTTVKWK